MYPGVAQLVSDPSAASGRYSEVSEWLRSIADEVASATRKISGTATGSAPAFYHQYKCISRCSAVGSAPALGD